MSSTPSGYIFSESATKRTAAAVKAHEATPLDLTDRGTERLFHAGDEVWVTIVANASGGGHYTGQIMTRPKTDIAPSSNAAATDFGTPRAPDFGAVYISNAPEIGKTTHALPAGKVCRGTVIRVQADRSIWVAVEAYDFFDCA